MRPNSRGNNYRNITQSQNPLIIFLNQHWTSNLSNPKKLSGGNKQNTDNTSMHFLHLKTSGTKVNMSESENTWRLIAIFIDIYRCIWEHLKSNGTKNYVSVTLYTPHSPAYATEGSPCRPSGIKPTNTIKSIKKINKYSDLAIHSLYKHFYMMVFLSRRF